jgi:hypothetical protein
VGQAVQGEGGKAAQEETVEEMQRTQDNTSAKKNCMKEKDKIG